jgi:hypothetical protein
MSANQLSLILNIVILLSKNSTKCHSNKCPSANSHSAECHFVVFHGTLKMFISFKMTSAEFNNLLTFFILNKSKAAAAGAPRQSA